MSSFTGQCSATEPIAVIGLACRLPGADGPEAFWRLLRSGTEAVGPAPAGRSDSEGSEYRRGGFLPDVDRFDAAFFGIPPAEAAAMDPQQRLVLELAWEALENARILPGSLRGEAAGVYLGAITSDYALLHDRLGEQALSRYSVTGTHRSIIANRVSYLLGLRGPSLTLDSGQSSSLVAVQLACEELRRGGATLALAGGVNLNLLTESTEALGRFGALSPGGRCHTFDSRANGYVRGEGGGLVVLKPLAAALADGDTVHCVVLGGAVTNDGGGEGLTVPDAEGQAEAVRLACEQAGVTGSQIQYVELHGTGTAVGDPIEAAALGGVLGAGRPADAPLLVGSAKTNIGHLEGAAGIVGLLKAALCLSHETLVPSLNFEAPNPAIPLAELGLDLVRETRDWPPGPAGRIAGVSAFGMGGTNCHLILGQVALRPAERRRGEPPQAGASQATPSPAQPRHVGPSQAAPRPAEPRQAAPRPAGVSGPGGEAREVPWLLSARSVAALRGQAERLAARLAEQPAAPADVALSLLRTRTVFEHRAVVLGADSGQLVARLREFAEGRPGSSVLADRACGGPRAFVFPGQGSQWAEMARELMDRPGAFAARLAICASALARYVDYDLLDVLRGTPGAPGLDRVDVVQPALWAVMVSLAELWRERGVHPELVIGHSQGEIAAATVIGALTLDDAARVVALRSRIIAQVSGRSGMLSVAAPKDQVEEWIAGRSGVVFAGENSPRSTVVAGAPEALELLRAELESRGQRCRLVAIDYASHTAAVDGLREELLTALAPIRPVAVPVPFYSSLAGGKLDSTAELDAEYWFRSLRNPVRFADATRAALAAGARLFVECSPHPLLVGAVEETAGQAGVEAGAVGTLRRGEGGTGRVLRSLAEAHVRGAEVDWDHDCALPGAALIDLPTYAFQRERHWLGAAAVTARHKAARPTGAESAESAHADQPGRPTAPASLGRLRTLVAGLTAELLGHADAVALDTTRSFKDLGLDSMGTVELRGRLRTATGLPLPSTLLFEYPTPERLAARLHQLGGGADEQRPTTEPVPPVRVADTAEPIAVVGIGCRYPGGVASPEELWQLVAEGRDAIGPLPADRGWDLDELLGSGPDRPGTCPSGLGGFLYGAAEFDAAFFGLSPREALAMDPQQRLLLETSWEALERAGIDPASLTGAPVGVFVGAMGTDYGPRLHRPGGQVDGHLLTGTALSVASGRIAYTLGLRGPALTVDTACSSSLVALHLAVQSLRRGECPLAVAGGVTVMANPGNLVEFTRQNGLAPDGRAKAFAAAADGTSFAEGAGMLVLERLSDARRNGHPVLAVIRGTAVNQDGASNGLTAPDGQAQRELIRRALADAGLAASDVDAVEAHGTGTALGDPVEANALLDVYGRTTGTERPLWLGSVKSNIGHTQAAAGVAGLIKLVEALRHEELPRTLHVDAPTPKADWAGSRVRLLTEPRPWPRGERTRRAAVSSFGISGTNAHLIVEEAEFTAVAEAEEAARPTAWVLSARSAAALRGQAARLAEAVATDSAATTGDVARSLAGRTRFEHRAVVLGTGSERLLAGLAAVAEGREDASAVTGRARGAAAATALLFTGQGGQRLGMGRELYAAFPEFATAFDEVCAALDLYLERPLREVVWGEDAALLDRTSWTQPALFAYETAAYRLLRSLGVEPQTVAGHSVGEFAAAHAAGVWDLADAARLVAARGRLMDRLPEGGAMVAVEASADEIAPDLVGRERELGLAAVNGPRSVVLSGEQEACLELAGQWEERGRRIRRLAVSHAFHSPLMEPMLADFAAELAAVTFRRPELAYRTALGADREWTDPQYWVDQVREAVRFAPLVADLAEAGTAVFLEVGPQAVLAGPARECLAGRPQVVAALARRGRGEHEALLHGLAEAFAAGTAVDWAAAAPGGRTVELPTYAFDRRRFWLTGESGPAGALLTRVVPLAGEDGLLLGGRLSARANPWLPDHAVGGTVILPGTAFVELAVQAARAAGAAGVAEILLQAPLVVPPTTPVELQVRLGGPDEQGGRRIDVHARPADQDGPWTLHATGRTAVTESEPAPQAWAAVWPPVGGEPVDLEDAYGRLEALGYAYGPAFQGLTAAWRAGEELYAEVRLPEAVRATAGGFAIHPALLDAVLHPLVLAAPADAAGPLVPFAFSRIDVARTGADRLRVRITPAPDGGHTLALCDGDGRRVGSIGSLAMRRISTGVTPGTAAPGLGLYHLDWTAFPSTAGAATPGEWAVLGDDALAERIGATAVTGLDAAVGWGVVIAPTPADGPVREALATVLTLVQQRLADKRLAGTRLVFLADPTTLTGAPIWGLVRCAQAEHPDAFVLADIADIADIGEPVDATALAGGLASGEPQFAVRGGQLTVPRLVRRRESGAPGSLGDGTVLITGGTGGLGGWLAEHLVERYGVRELLLVSRRGPAAEGADALAGRLREAGANVRIEACDVADRAALTRLLAAVPADRPLVSVVHTAGVLADTLIGGLDPERLDTVLAPKADAAWLLHELTADLPLHAFVLFSSVAAVLGHAGQANYAAANGFLDGLAAHRHGLGLPALSIAWGLWSGEAGMGAGLTAADEARLGRAGLGALSREQGLALFDAALAGGSATVTAARFNLPALREGSAAAPVLRAMAPAPRRAGDEPSVEKAPMGLAERLTGLDEESARRLVLELVRTRTALVLGHDSPEAVEVDRPFTELGFDSLTAVELREQLCRGTGLALPTTLTFDRPSVRDVTDYLMAELAPARPSAADALRDALDRVAELLDRLDPDQAGEEAARAEASLQTALHRLRGSRTADAIDAASDEELFQFIDSL